MHLAADAVLVGPVGRRRHARPCGQCLALRWQRLRSRSEREALETGSRPGSAGRLAACCRPAWCDAVGALHFRRSAAGAATPPAPGGAS